MESLPKQDAASRIMKQQSLDNPNGIVNDFEGDLEEFQDDLREFEDVSGLPKDDDGKTQVSVKAHY